MRKSSGNAGGKGGNQGQGSGARPSQGGQSAGWPSKIPGGISGGGRDNNPPAKK